MDPKPPPQPGSLAARIDALKKTPVAERPTERLVEMKVLVLGLCRTGTESMREALYKLGYNDVLHMRSLHLAQNGESDTWARAYQNKIYGKGNPLSREEWDQLTGQYEAVTDVPAAHFPGQLMDLYPDAKIVLTVRDSPAAWHTSMKSTVYHQRQMIPWLHNGLKGTLARLIMPVPAIANMLRLTFTDLFDASGTAFERDGEQRYTDHNKHVLRLASDRDRDVLTFNVKEGWEPLCRFLGKDVPDTPFPRTNDTAEWRGRLAAMKKQQKSLVQILTPLLLQTVQFAGVVGVAAWLWRRYGP